MDFIAGSIFLGSESKGHEYGGSQKDDSVELSDLTPLTLPLSPACGGEGKGEGGG